VFGKTMALKIWSHEQIKGALSSPFSLSLFFLLSVLIVFKFAIRKSKTNTNQPPSPPKLPVIGNLHQLGTLPYRSLRDLSRKYGNIMMLQLGQRQTLVISSADVAMEIMNTHDLAFSNRAQTTASKILFYAGTDVGFTHYGENWRQKRKICVLELLSMKSVQSFHQIRKDVVEELVSKLREASSNDACVNLSKLLTETTNNVICACSLGRKYGGDSDNRVKEIARKVMHHLSEFVVGDYFPLFGWIDVLTGKISKFKDTFRALDGLFDQVIEERLQMKKTGNDQIKNKGFIDILLQLQEDDGKLGFRLSNNNIKGILGVLFSPLSS
jgi:cytochrome P450 family 71 subfamily A